MRERKHLLIRGALLGLAAGLAACTHPGPESLNNTRDLASVEADQLNEGRCYGVNNCRGTTGCGGEGHTCAGKNTCKGEGWAKMSRRDCEEEGGSFQP